MLSIGGRLQENNKNKAYDGSEDRDELADALERVFHQVRESLIAHENGFVSTGPFAIDKHGMGKRAHYGLKLYDGLSGIALFIAAYSFASKNTEARDLAVLLVARLRLEVRHLVTNSNRADGLSGMGALPYVFVQLATWLKMPELMDVAREVTASITPRQILTEDRLDVVQGCAGTLLSLLSFTEEVAAMGSDSGPALELALLCGRHLLDKRVSYKSGPRAWPAIDSPPLSGFAYGAAGISYALVRLFRFTGLEEFREAAIEGFAFERTLYIPQLQTWFDSRCNLPLAKASWCEGAPGVALGILGSRSAIDSHALRHDLEQALNITRNLLEGPVDNLCCGNFGRVEIMNIAGSVLGRLQLTEYARQLAAEILERAEKSGFRFQMPHDPADSQENSGDNLSLFLGLAGVGYTLLRLNYPDLFPSVLLLETLN
jgi:lantibiotic modifying enzyme